MGADYSGHFYLYDSFWILRQGFYFKDAPELHSQFIFFGFDADGSMYAFWTYEGKTLQTAPIVFLGSEGVGLTVLANSLVEFLSLLSLGVDELGFAVVEPDWHLKVSSDEKTIHFQEWLRSEIGVSCPNDPKSIVDAAKKQHPDLQEWADKHVHSSHH